MPTRAGQGKLSFGEQVLLRRTSPRLPAGPPAPRFKSGHGLLDAQIAKKLA